MRIIRQLVLALGILGCTVFSLGLAASIANPGFVEEIAKDIIRHEVEKRVHEKVEALDGRFLSGKAGILVARYAEQSNLARGLLAAQVPARVAAVIAEMRNLSCECRKHIEANIREGFEWDIADASAAQERLTALIRTKYMDTASQVTREFRIFTATNALVFALLIVAVLVKRKAGAHLLPAAFVLLAAASLTAYCYLFNQDWLHTLVFSDYMGWGYVAWLGIAFGFLADIIFNAGRVTVQVLNAIFNIVGSALQFSPC